MYDAKQSANDSKTLLKIGYMSTVNIQQIVSRYATGCAIGCGHNNIVWFENKNKITTEWLKVIVFC